MLPPNAQPVSVEIRDLNCWVEDGRFFVTGICANKSADWQKIWLEGTPVGADGKPVQIKGLGSVIFPTFSDAVPPQGRTSFFAFWPVGDFSAQPKSCQVKSAGAVLQGSGSVLLAEDISGVKMLVPLAPNLPATEEVGWQANGILHNPLQIPAHKLRLELLIFGTDQRLWLSTLLNPEDAATKKFLHLEREGPLQPGEKRPFGLQISYEHMPQALKEKKIGRVELLAFEAL